MALRIHLGLAGEKLAGSEGRAVVSRLGLEVDEALSEVRSIAHGVPPALAEHGLAIALRSASRWTAVPVRIVDGGMGRHAADVESTVYFCCLEALQNAAKHGGPGVGATIVLGEAGGTLSFSIEDDGAGFDLAAAGRGDGMANLAERVRSLGGTMRIDSAPAVERASSATCRCNLSGSGPAMLETTTTPASAEGLTWLAGGTFLMGSEDFYPEERPVRPVQVDGFWIEPHAVTVEAFRRFVAATGHVTVAERGRTLRGRLSRRRPRAARARLAGLPAAARAPSTSTTTARGGRTWPARTGANPKGPVPTSTPAPAPGHACGVRRRGRVRGLGRALAPDRGRVGVRRTRRARRRPLCVG